MDLSYPLYEEWRAAMQDTVASNSEQLVEDDEMLSLFTVVDVVLRPHLEMNPHIDYDDCFRAKGCAKEIFLMNNPKKRLAAMAFVRVLRASRAPLTHLMGENIFREFLAICQTGVLPKTYREVQKEEQEKEQKGPLLS